MATAPFREDEEHGRDIAELLRRAQAHQQQAQHLLALAEQISRQDRAARRYQFRERETTHFRFTERESNVVELLVTGMSNRLIARTLKISERTVKNHLSSIFHKLRVVDRTQAVIVLMRGAGNDGRCPGPRRR